MGGKRYTDKQIYELDLSRRRVEIFDAFVESCLSDAKRLEASGDLEAAYMEREYVKDLEKWVKDVRQILKSKGRGAPIGETMVKEIFVAVIEELATQPGNPARAKKYLLSRNSWDIQARISGNGH